MAVFCVGTGPRGHPLKVGRQPHYAELAVSSNTLGQPWGRGRCTRGGQSASGFSVWSLEVTFWLTTSSGFLDHGNGNLDGDTRFLAPVSIVGRHEINWWNFEMGLFPGLTKWDMPSEPGGAHFTLLTNLQECIAIHMACEAAWALPALIPPISLWPTCCDPATLASIPSCCPTSRLPSCSAPCLECSSPHLHAMSHAHLLVLTHLKWDPFRGLSHSCPFLQVNPCHVTLSDSGMAFATLWFAWLEAVAPHWHEGL